MKKIILLIVSVINKFYPKKSSKMVFLSSPDISNNSFAFFKKLFDLLFGYPLYALSLLTPRNPKKIVIGSHTPFNDNSKYFFLLSQEYLQDYELIWITKDKDIEERIRKLSLKAYRQYSLKGLYHTLTAKFYIYSFHLIDINFWTSGGSVKFNLWHGIPLKDIAFEIKRGPSVKLYNEKSILSRVVRPQIFVRPDFMLTTSSEMSNYFAKAFRINSTQCLKYGMSRCDILSYPKEKLQHFIQKYELPKTLLMIKQFENYDKIFIYMPTWREKVDFLLDAGFELDTLNKVMKKENRLFIFKLHPFSKLKKIKLEKINSYSNLVVLDSDMDIYPILPFTDTLISDYSSIYYDYLLCDDKEIFLYPYDYDSYILENRDLAFDYESSMPAVRIKNFKHLLDILVLPKDNFSQEQLQIKSRYFEHSTNTTQQLSKFIKSLNI